VAGELAAWEEHRASTGRKACITFARRTLVIEKERLQGLIRASRMAGLDLGGSKTKKSSNGLSGMYWQEASHGRLSNSQWTNHIEYSLARHFSQLTYTLFTHTHNTSVIAISSVRSTVRLKELTVYHVILVAEDTAKGFRLPNRPCNR